jgi:hypothetical protein
VGAIFGCLHAAQSRKYKKVRKIEQQALDEINLRIGGKAGRIVLDNSLLIGC